MNPFSRTLLVIVFLLLASLAGCARQPFSGAANISTDGSLCVVMTSLRLESDKPINYRTIRFRGYHDSELLFTAIHWRQNGEVLYQVKPEMGDFPNPDLSGSQVGVIDPHALQDNNGGVWGSNFYLVTNEALRRSPSQATFWLRLTSQFCTPPAANKRRLTADIETADGRTLGPVEIPIVKEAIL